jgi:hypothetical protein
MCGWLSRIFVEKMRTFPKFAYRYRHKDCTYIILCVQNTTMITWRRLQFYRVGHRRVRSLQGRRAAIQTAITFLVASWPKSVNAPANIMRTSGNTLWFGRCIEKISQYRRNRIRISVVCTECVQIWRIWSWLRLYFSCSDFWIWCGEHLWASTGENWEHFGG